MCCEDCYAEMPDQFEAFPDLVYCQHRSPDYAFNLRDQTFAEMQTYLGQRCAVVLSNFDPPVIQVGVLVSLEDDGEVTIDDDEGVRHHAWPALEIRYAATLEIGDYFSRCSHCNGNASPHEDRHLRGGPGSGYAEGSALSDFNGCGAIFVEKTNVYARGLHGSTG